MLDGVTNGYEDKKFMFNLIILLCSNRYFAGIQSSKYEFRGL